MRIDCDVTVDDLGAFNLHVMNTQSHFRRMYRAGFVAGPLIGFALLALTGHEGLFSSVVKVAGASVLFSGLYVYFYRKVITDSVRKIHNQESSGLAIGPRSISITPEGLTEVSEHTTMQERWPGIRQVEDTPSALYFFNGPTSAYILPKRAFADEAQVSAFLAAVDRFRSG